MTCELFNYERSALRLKPICNFFFNFQTESFSLHGLNSLVGIEITRTLGPVRRISAVSNAIETIDNEMICFKSIV